MKKSLQQLLFVWTLGLFAFNVNAQVSIGSGTLVDQGMPIDAYYGYSYSQSVYLASEIGVSGTITGVTFYATPSMTLTNGSDWVVYMATSARTTYASSTDWEPIVSFTEVFNGTATVVGGEVSITFTTPFVYNGTDNLIIATEDNMPGYDGSSDDFYCSSVTGNRSIYYRNDTNNPDPLTPPTASGLRQSVPNIEFAGITQSCAAPTALTVTNITTTAADVSWTTGSVSTTQWDVSIVPAGNGPQNGFGISTNPFNATGLTANTDYDVYVRDICGVGDSSTWTGSFSFTTACDVFTAPFAEPFATAVFPDCWTQGGATNWEFGSNASTPTGFADYGAENAPDNTVGGGGTFIGMDGSDNGDAEVSTLETPLVDISTLTTPQLSYYVFYDNTIDGALNKLIVDFYDGTSWTQVDSIQNNLGSSWVQFTTDLTAYTVTGPVQVRFTITGDGSGGDTYNNDILIDDVELRNAPTCLNPTGLAVSNLMPTSVDVSWTTGSVSTTVWDVSIVPAGNGPLQSLFGTATNPYNATGLTANTDYDAYVRDICGAGDSSAWIGPVSFTTPCTAFDGDDATTPIVLTGTNATATGNSSECFTNQAVGGGFSPTAPDVWYEYTLDTCIDSLIVSLCGSSFDTYLTVFASNGTTVIALNDDNFANCGSGGNSHLEIDLNTNANISAGDLIYIVVDGYNAASGTFTLNTTQITSAIVPVIDVQSACGPFTWNGMTYATSGMYSWTGMTVEGCDSIVTLDLTINTPTSFTDVQTSCDSLVWNGTTYTTSGMYMWTGTNAGGCDSTVTLDLTINNATSFTDVQTACDTLTWNGTTYSASGMYMWTGTNAVGCDSVVTLDLTINNTSSSSATEIACDSLVWNGTTYTTSGVYSWIGTNAVGCDSSVILNLTINNSSAFTDVQTACDSLVWNGSTYTTSGMYMWTGTNAVGCDSVVTLDLTINNASLTTEVETACVSYDWNGMTYALTGIYFWTGTNAAGCDSVVVLDLTINAVDVAVTNNDPSIMADATGATYQWIDCDNANTAIAGETGQTFTATANGNYAVVVTENGCSDTSDCIAIVTVSLDNVSPLEGVSVYPNPVSNVVNVDLGGLENAEVRLLDMSGKVLRTELCETTDLFTMEMNQAPGAYIIEVQSNEFVKQFKLIKE